MKAIRRRNVPDGPARAPVFYVHTDAQWECLRSPVRHEIVQFLASLGPSSIAELARAMDVAPDGLYHHANRLAAAGLIRVAGEVHTGRRRERRYDLAAERLRFDVDIATHRNIDRLRQMLRARLAHADAEFDRALRARRLRVEEPLADILMDAGCAWLDEDTLQRVRRHLQSVQQILAVGRRTRAGRLFSLTIVMSPVVRARDSATRPTKRFAATTGTR